jgi:hypothetical protein
LKRAVVNALSFFVVDTFILETSASTISRRRSEFFSVLIIIFSIFLRGDGVNETDSIPESNTITSKFDPSIE